MADWCIKKRLSHKGISMKTLVAAVLIGILGVVLCGGMWPDMDTLQRTLINIPINIVMMVLWLMAAGEQQ